MSMARSAGQQPAADYVRLNVGGKAFCTTRNTLTKDPNSLLSRMLHYGGSHFALEDEHGDYFLDRNPRCFEYILDYLRDGEYFCRPDDLQALLREANYYQLPGLVKRVELELDQHQELRTSPSSSSSATPSSVRLLRGGSSATLTTATPSAATQQQQQQQTTAQQQQQQAATTNQQQQLQQQSNDNITLLAAQSIELLRRIDDSCRRIWSFCSRILVGQDGYLHVKRY